MTTTLDVCSILEAVLLNEPVSIDAITAHVQRERLDIAMTVLELDRHGWLHVGVDGVTVGDRLRLILDNREKRP